MEFISFAEYGESLLPFAATQFLGEVVVLRSARKFMASLAAVSVAMGTLLLLAPLAHAANGSECQFSPGRNMWHFQNYTASGKTVVLDGYSGPDATGNPVVSCSFHLKGRAAFFGRSKGGSAYLDPSTVKTVKVTTTSNHGGDPVGETLDNSGNACFRIVYNDRKTSWELIQIHHLCDPN